MEDNELTQDGTTGATPARPVDDTQKVPDGAATGEALVDTTAPADGEPSSWGDVLANLLNIFKPQPKTTAVATPEMEHGKPSSEQGVADALRFLTETPIKVVDTPARTVKFPRHVVTTTPTRIAGYQPTRKRLLIKVGGNHLYLGDGPDVSAETGYYLETTDDVLELRTQGEVYAVAATGEAVVYTVGEHYK